MHFSLIDLAIVGLAGAALWDGARRGFVAYASELVALALGLTVAFAFFEPLGRALAQIPGVPLGLASFGAFLGLLLVTHGVVYGPGRRLAALLWRQGGERLASPAREAAGSLPALGLTSVLLAVILSAMVVIPAPGASQLVLGSALARPLIASSSFLEPPLRVILGQARPEVGTILTSPPTDPGVNAFYRLHFPPGLILEPDPVAETAMLNQMNQVRTQAGLAPLTGLPELQAVARAHSQDMYERDYFSHNTPDGITPYQRLSAAGVKYVTAGENIAFAPDEAKAWSLLIQSSEHRANILNPDFLCVGVGAIRAQSGYEEMFTQDFTDC
ncbi:MAG TPA: CvpA family protein [Candidatus Nitrosotalea sp.]|nr:CvpA family protein [Candidatus Nitrosotalea sp.]